VTLRQLLSHTAGTTVHGFPGYPPGQPSPTATQVLDGAPPANTGPVFVSALPGTLSLLTDANGSQVTYNGHPLYTYSGDTAPGQVNGDGFGGIWFVAPTNLASSSGSNSNGYPKGGYPDYGN